MRMPSPAPGQDHLSPLPVADTQLQVQLLGRMTLHWQGEPLPVTAPRLRALLAYLALEGPSTRDTLTGLLWPGRGSQHLRQALYTLRTLPGVEYWLEVGTGPLVALRTVTDIDQLRAQVQAGDDQGAVCSPQHAGPLLLDLDLDDAPAFQDWLEEQRRNIVELRQRALTQQARQALQLGDLSRGRVFFQDLLDLDPLDEETYRQWMRLEAQVGDPEQVPVLFGRCRQALRQELDAEPDEETLALLRNLEGQSALRDQPVVWIEVDPERGHRAFGRAAELDTAQEMLARQGRVLLQGLAGIGKTELARSLAEGWVAQGDRVLWCPLGDDPPGPVLAALLTALGARPKPDRPLKELQAELHTALQDSQVAALVLDDAWSSYTVQVLQEALPPGTKVVVTSRQRLPGWPRVALDRLARQDAMALVAEELRAPLPPATLDAVCALLGDHPYALRLAARTLRETETGAAALMRDLGEAPHTLGAEQSLGALLRHSVQRLDEEAYEAYLGMGALCSPSTTPDLLALTVRRGLEATEQALFRLMERGLVTREGTAGSELVRFVMHDLTWHAARSVQGLLPGSVLRSAAEYAATNSSQPAALALELPNLLGAAREARRFGQADALVGVMAGLLKGPYLAANGFPHGQLPLLEAAEAAAVEHEQWTEAALLAGKLGDVHQALFGDARSGITWYLKARDHAAQAGLSERQAIFTSLAGTLMAMQRLPETETTFAEALGYAEQSGNPVCRARVLEQQGVMYAMRKDFAAARDSLGRAREALHPLLTAQHPHFQEAQSAYCNVTSNLGQAEQRLGHLEKALELKCEALNIALERQETLRIANARSDIGEVLMHMGLAQEAKTELSQAVELYRNLGASGRETATLMLLSALPA
jgi:DNA-binding SARP family transcriptional activator/tetratricopeptide (TPR) repeat protein